MNPLESVQAELAIALREQGEIATKVKSLQEAARLLEPIYGRKSTAGLMGGLAALADISDLGLTAAIERILMRNADNWLPPTSVRNGLVEAGFELVGDNPLASIHQVLRRLVARETCFVSEEIQGQTMYKYDSSKAAIQLTPELAQSLSKGSGRKLSLQELAGIGKKK
jgi:hypothetical protein